MKSLFQIYQIVNTRLNFLVFLRATQFKYALNINLVFKLFIDITFFAVKVPKFKWSGLYKRLSGAVFLKEKWTRLLK